MDAGRALADLVEIAPQIEAAVVLAPGGEALGSIGVSDWWATSVAQAGRALLDGAAEVPAAGGRVTQIHASLAEGDVFGVVSEPGRAIVAVTTARQAPGLVFYDLKRCLAALDDAPAAPPPPAAPTPPPAPRRRLWGRKEPDDAA